MAPRKLPRREKQIHVGVSMPPDMWATAQSLAHIRHLSASAILREALTEYLSRRGLVSAPVPEPREMVPA